MSQFVIISISIGEHKGDVAKEWYYIRRTRRGYPGCSHLSLKGRFHNYIISYLKWLAGDEN
jgi:hypothetical protein